MWSQFITPICAHTIETNPHSTCLWNHVVTAELVPGDLMIWCSIMIVTLMRTKKTIAQLSLLHFSWSDKTSQWPSPLISSATHGKWFTLVTFRLRLDMWLQTLVSWRNQGPLICQSMVYCLYGGGAAGWLMLWAAGLPRCKRVIIRGTFAVCRSTWIWFLLNSGRSWIMELGCL